MLKYFHDLFISLLGIVFLSPILFVSIVFIWINDFSNPFYFAERVGINKKKFIMIKLRTMFINADKSGVESTADDDHRITKIGKIIRKFKIDEIMQLINVIKGDMSLVGPRPNTLQAVESYSNEEKKILSVKPGITDLSSIIFSDEGKILENSSEPDLDYNQLIRPWKSKLCLLYITKNNLITDYKILFLTLLSFFSTHLARNIIANSYGEIRDSKDFYAAVIRDNPLKPSIPPGFNKIID